MGDAEGSTADSFQKPILGWGELPFWRYVFLSVDS